MAKVQFHQNKSRFNLMKWWWWMVYCIIGFGIPHLVDSRYLPTRRSEPNSYGLDRLGDLIKDVIYQIFTLFSITYLLNETKTCCPFWWFQ